MNLIKFECEDCHREFVMAETDVVDEDGMSCPIDACQGTVVNVDAGTDDNEDDDTEDEEEEGEWSGDEEEASTRLRQSRHR